MIEAHPHLGRLDKAAMPAPSRWRPLLATVPARSDERRSASPSRDFYLTNPIARASAVMAECSALAAGRRAEAAE